MILEIFSSEIVMKATFPGFRPGFHRKLIPSRKILPFGIFRGCKVLVDCHKIPQFGNDKGSMLVHDRATDKHGNENFCRWRTSFSVWYLHLDTCVVVSFGYVALEKRPKMVSRENPALLKVFCASQLTRRPLTVQRNSSRGVGFVDSGSDYWSNAFMMIK